MTVATAKLYSGVPAAGVFTFPYTVPAGQTHIVKSAVLTNQGGTADVGIVGVYDTAGKSVFMLYSVAVPAGATVRWDGWVAVAPGDQLVVYSASGLVTFWVSGSKLIGVA